MSEHHITPLRTYLIIAASLLFLSGVTVWVSYIDLGSFNIVLAMFVATVKASLVAFFFMHLLWDDKKNLTMFLMSLMSSLLIKKYKLSSSFIISFLILYLLKKSLQVNAEVVVGHLRNNIYLSKLRYLYPHQTDQFFLRQK